MSKTSGFNKFINKENPAAKKEKFKQEKRSWKKKEAEAREERRQNRGLHPRTEMPGTKEMGTAWKKREEQPGDKTGKWNQSAAKPARTGAQWKKTEDKPAKPAGYWKDRDNKPAKPAAPWKKDEDRPAKAGSDWKPKTNAAKSDGYKGKASNEKTGTHQSAPAQRSAQHDQSASYKKSSAVKSDAYKGKTGGEKTGRPQSAAKRPVAQYGQESSSYKKNSSRATGQGANTNDKRTAAPRSSAPQMPLNKYIAHCGVCSRRDAADLVKGGKVTVDGDIIYEPGYKMNGTEVVKVNGTKIVPSRNFVYILLNKPKDYITTAEDPEGRHTVMDLVKHATDERVYPVGRLDRNTSGVLLLTNDGDLAQLLTHPKNEVKKIYQVTLDKPLTKADFDRVLGGIMLEDGMATVDVLAYSDPKDKTQIGLEIHSGRNRIVRRIFEALGYDVKGLDRVMFAGLTKKNVTRGKWRFLNEREVRTLKHFNK
jgi:23S rRNA pseudouridine2605 synthase